MHQHPEHQPDKPAWFDDVWSMLMVLTEIAEWQPLGNMFRDKVEMRSSQMKRKKLVVTQDWKGAFTAQVFQYGFGFLEKDRQTLEKYSHWKVKDFYDGFCELLSSKI
ncbi:hypothetical protein NKR23_g10943 [Pleurostoma richardsiae]|uniref:Uncharacterized protein n=1 Tax=Pleurostoma richardsiae TaxID=41990 RepID=A0AA38R4C8_9PEZI|nr:hypothetical protein NKR23_g10943 [Pleurostoma richardsiae]